MPRLLSTLLLMALMSLPVQADNLGWVDLFNGKNLEGWTQRNGTATYRIEGDSIVGKTAEGSPNSFLCTDKLYSDFELKFDVKVDNELNSGVQIRSQNQGGTPDGRVNGPQVEIAINGTAGYVYGEAAGGWMTPDELRQTHTHFKEEQWNSYHVKAVGARIMVWLNGKLISDLVDEDKLQSHPKGFIGLQVHGIGAGSGPYEVRWRNLQLRDLSEYQSLFNGKNLEGWTTQGNWSVQADGSLLIQPREGEMGWQRYDAYIWSNKKYKDFILDLEYTYPPGGNSGIFFRVGDTADPVKQGIEAQVLDTFGNESALGAHDHGGVISTVGPTKNMSAAPHQWNRMVIQCVGSQLMIELNGQQIVDIDLSSTPVKDRPSEGFIGLQDHGQPNNLRFRNLRILEL
ncbi:DUF1080 domain-containing protein [bacterium]|nr:DUF1080 domain-containing protein [bacterium]